MGWAEMKAAKAIKPGQWHCAGCYVINEVDAIECISCETPKPGKEEEVKAAKAAKKAALFAPKPAATAPPAASTGGFSFGVGGGTAAGGAAAPAAASASGTGGFSFGVSGGAAQAAKPAASTGGFKFGTGAAAAAPAAPKPAPDPKPAAKAAPAVGGWAAMKAAKAMKEGQWKCAGCYVINEADAIECVSCETVRPGKEEEAKAKKAAAAGAFSFGVGPGATAAAKSASPVGEAAPAAPAGGFKFGASPAATGTSDSADGGGKRQKGNEPASTSVSVSIEGDGKLGLVFVAGSEPPVVKAVSEDGLAAKAGGLKVGLVLTHVQGTAVASLSHDDAKALIKNASRPLALTFTKKDPASSSNGFSFTAPAAAATSAPASAAGGFKFGVSAAPSTASSMQVEGDRREPREPARFRPGITSGSVLVSGSGDCGQLGLGMKHSDLSEPHHLSLLDRKSIVKITCGGMHSIALDCDGALWTWGCNDDYTLGRVDKKDEGVPRRVTALTEHVVEISAGACHSAVLTKGGDVYTWGTYKDSNGHIGFKIGNDDELVFKQQLPDLMEEMVGKDVCQLASGSDFTLALTKDGSLYGWGDAENANIGAPIPKNKAEKRKRLRPTGPIKVSAGGGGKRKQAGSSKVLTQIAAGGWHVLAMDDEGNILGFGLNNFGQCGDGTTETPCSDPTVIAPLVGKGVKQLAAGMHNSMALLEDGTVMTWGRGDYCQLGTGPPPREDSHSVVPVKCYPMSADLPGARHIDSGDSHCLLVTKDDALFTWGFGTMGALANGDYDDIDVPTEVDADAFPSAVKGGAVMTAACGGQHTAMLVL